MSFLAYFCSMIEQKTKADADCRLTTGFPTEWLNEGTTMSGGSVMLVEQGEARLHADARSWRLLPGSVAVLFPNDWVRLTSPTPDFRLTRLCYSAEMLNEAGTHMEISVYEHLRTDCCRTGDEEVTTLTRLLLETLAIYFASPERHSLRRQTLLALQGYLLGVHDTVKQLAPPMPGGENGTGVANRLFCDFMELLTVHCRREHDVAFYAHRLSVTPKHLTAVSRRITGHSAKKIIDSRVLSLVKNALRQSRLTVKEIAYRHNFPSDSYFCQYFRRNTGISPQQFRHDAEVERTADAFP